MQVNVSARHGHLKAEDQAIIVSAEHSHDFVATTQSTSIIAALDMTIGKVEQQIRKHKEKVTQHKGVGGKHVGGDLPGGDQD